jgi:hypothetical protein
MTTAPAIEQPDLEAWVWQNISDLHGVTSFVYMAGTFWPGWIYAHSVQVDARAKTKTEARDLAEQVRQRIFALAALPWPDGTVSFVDVIEGPFWLPDADGAPRYCARYEIRVHPRRSSTPAMVAG